jgi:hypothetical protein
MAGSRVQELCGGAELLEHSQPEVDVAEQAPLLGRREHGRRAELARAADVVDERRGHQEVGAQPRMDLAELAAERRHADRVLEQAAGVRVVAVRGRRIRAQRRVRECPRDDAAQCVVVHLADQEL